MRSVVDAEQEALIRVSCCKVSFFSITPGSLVGDSSRSENKVVLHKHRF